MKEFMSTSTDSSLSPVAMLELNTEVFLGMERDMCLSDGSLLPLNAPAACLGGRSRVLLTRRGLESKVVPTSPAPPRDLSGEE